MIRDGRSINGYKPIEYMVSKKCLAAWSELCFRISKLKSPHIKIVLETDNSEYKWYRISEKSFVFEPGVLYKQLTIAANERQECKISLDTLEEYFRDKFDVKEDQNSELVTKFEQTVGEKYEQLQHREYQVDISEHKIKKVYSAAEARKGSGS